MRALNLVYRWSRFEWLVHAQEQHGTKGRGSSPGRAKSALLRKLRRSLSHADSHVATELFHVPDDWHDIETQWRAQRAAAAEALARANELEAPLVLALRAHRRPVLQIARTLGLRRAQVAAALAIGALQRDMQAAASPRVQFVLDAAPATVADPVFLEREGRSTREVATSALARADELETALVLALRRLRLTPIQIGQALSLPTRRVSAALELAARGNSVSSLDRGTAAPAIR